MRFSYQQFLFGGMVSLHLTFCFFASEVKADKELPEEDSKDKTKKKIKRLWEDPLTLKHNEEGKKIFVIPLNLISGWYRNYFYSEGKRTEKLTLRVNEYRIKSLRFHDLLYGKFAKASDIFEVPKEKPAVLIDCDGSAKIKIVAVYDNTNRKKNERYVDENISKEEIIQRKNCEIRNRFLYHELIYKHANEKDSLTVKEKLKIARLIIKAAQFFCDEKLFTRRFYGVLSVVRDGSDKYRFELPFDSLIYHIDNNIMDDIILKFKSEEKTVGTNHKPKTADFHKGSVPIEVLLSDKHGPLIKHIKTLISIKEKYSKQKSESGSDLILLCRDLENMGVKKFSAEELEKMDHQGRCTLVTSVLNLKKEELSSFYRSVLVYMCSMSFYTLFTGRAPFGTYKVDSFQFMEALQKNLRPKWGEDDKFHQDIKELIENMWSTEYKSRPSFQNVLEEIQKLEEQEARSSF